MKNSGLNSQDLYDIITTKKFDDKLSRYIKYDFEEDLNKNIEYYE